MKDVVTYVGIDAHTRELHVAMLIGTAATPVTWTVENGVRGVRTNSRTACSTSLLTEVPCSSRASPASQRSRSRAAVSPTYARDLPPPPRRADRSPAP